MESFPTGRIATRLRKGRYSDRVSRTSATYMAGVLRYLTTELLHITARKANESLKTRLSPRQMMLAVHRDTEFSELLRHVTICGGGSVPTHSINVVKKKKGTGAKKAPKKAAASKKDATAKKTGLTYKNIHVSGVSLSKEETADATLLFRRGTQSHKWQFKNDSGSWGDYDADASGAVELAYASWLVDPHIDVRSVSSGDWEYMVDFNMMTQQNVRHEAHTTRKIQRVPVF